MKKLFAIVFICSLIFSACRKDPPELKAEYLTPLIHANLDYNNLRGDSLLVSNPDGSLSLVYRYAFKQISLSDIMKIPDTTLLKNLNLNSIRLGERLIETKVTLGQLARGSGPEGNLILLFHGQHVPIPAISNTSAGVVEFDATDMFESIEVKSGTLEMIIDNGLPIEITDLSFVFRNKVSGSAIFSDYISSLPAGDKFSKTYSLDGVYFEGMLETEIISLSSPGTGTNAVLIDTNDAINVSMKINIDSVTAATAIFPAQNLFEMKENVEYQLNGPLLTFMRIKSGLFKVIVASTLQDSSYIYYEIPSAKYKGVEPLVYNIVLPPAPKGDTVYMTQTFPVDDYWFDLTGIEGDKFNTYYHSMIMRIDSTGKMMDLSLRDSLYLYYTLYDVVPDYVIGYLGQEQDRYIGSTAIDVFRNIEKGSIDLEDVNIAFFIDNEAGAEGVVRINDIQMSNSKTSVSKRLQAIGLNDDITVKAATDKPLKASYTHRSFTNSNAAELISLFPDLIEYDISYFLNPQGNNFRYDEFLYNSSIINAGVEVEVPLHLMSNGLALLDTLEFSLGLNKNAEPIRSANLRLDITNSYPLSTMLQLYFLDDKKQMLDSLFTQALHILPGFLGATDERVSEAINLKLSIPIDEVKLQRLNNADFVVVRAVFDTLPQGRKVKFYSDYSMKVKLNADFKYNRKF